MDEYFSTVTDEQFQKDLIAAGIENCPDKEGERAMIQIKVYKNGYEIIGHSNPVTCSEVSILAWACGNTIYNKYDENLQLYQSAIDNKENPNEGYTWMTFNPDIEGANRVFEEWQHNLHICLKYLWKPSDVSLENVEGLPLKKAGLMAPQSLLR